ncbi:MAG: flavodoxin domain-containing protein [Proteobacteria bacterium]|nr:flavodoxin domain-containing protein [Pseudomonadota bacterium]
MHLTILVGTMTGTAELVAEEIQTVLEADGHGADIKLMDGLDSAVFQPDGPYLIVTSTYGQGDVPDNTRALMDSLERSKPDLSKVRYGIFALGDRTYTETFCLGGKQFDAMLRDLGAQRVGEILMHDASAGTMPEEVALDWIPGWLSLCEESLA